MTNSENHIDKNRIHQGVLFDFDGVLAKTMEYNYLAWQKTLLKYGVNITPEIYYPLEGKPSTNVAAMFLETIKSEESIDPLTVAREKDLNFLKENKFELYDGVIEFISLLKSNGVRIGMVTGGSKERIFSTLPSEFLKLFDIVITANDTERGKPYPDPYLKGLELLEIEADSCFVVENAPLGIQSAKNAGIFCIAISSTLSKDYLVGADLIINEFIELKDLNIFRYLEKK